MYNYFVYGCNVQSDIKLYNIPESNGKPEIYIRQETIERPFFLKDEQEAFYSKDYIYFQTEFCEFVIKDGTSILLNPTQDADMNLVTSFIIGYGFAYVFSQRGATAFHCTALSMYGKGILISGVSGAGKSTTAYSLVNRGHKYLADDIAMMYPKDNMQIVPAFPIQKICANDIEGIPHDKLLYINETRDKYSYYNIEQFETVPRECVAIFFITVDDVEDVIIEEQTGLNKYLRVLECQFLVETYIKVGTPDEDKQNCLKLASKVRLFKITRPRNENTLDQITEMIEEAVRE